MILFHNIVFGPVKSRRLGVSLGINLLPDQGKWCNFDCIYCECGWNADGRKDKQLPTREMVRATLEHRLADMQQKGEAPDVITFSGNGEPTMHPDFPAIVDDTLALRNQYFPKARVCVLSNATNLHRDEIRAALQRLDCPILKLDSAINETCRAMNIPQGNYSVQDIVEQMKRLNGNFILQTMFLRGEVNGKRIDNTTADEVEKWMEIVRQVNPREVMIYTIDRETPAKNLEKLTLPELEKIADKLRAMNVKVQVSG